MSNVPTTQSARTWFCVFNSPRTIWGEEATPEEMVNAALDLWMENKPRRSCAGNYEIGDTGIEYEEVNYWDEMTEIFDWARTHVTSTLYNK